MHPGFIPSTYLPESKNTCPPHSFPRRPRGRSLLLLPSVFRKSFTSLGYVFHHWTTTHLPPRFPPLLCCELPREKVNLANPRGHCSVFILTSEDPFFSGLFLSIKHFLCLVSGLPHSRFSFQSPASLSMFPAIPSMSPQPINVGVGQHPSPWSSSLFMLIARALLDCICWPGCQYHL